MAYWKETLVARAGRCSIRFVSFSSDPDAERRIILLLLNVGVEDSGLDRASVFHLDENPISSSGWKAIGKGDR